MNDGNGKKLSNNETTTADNLELTFSDHGNSSVNTFDCSLDGKSAEECTSPYVIENISLGSHRFQVRGIEDDQGASYDTYSWIRKEKVELESALESSIQSPSLTQLVLPQGSGPVNPNPPNNISKSQPQNMPLFSILALDTAGPAVTSTNPINGTTEVPLDKVITATFNGTVQSSTVNASVDSSIDGNGDDIKDGSPIQPNNISKSRPQNMPLYPLLELDTSGPVVTSTDPINGTTEVPLDKVITATFNEPGTEFYGKFI